MVSLAQLDLTEKRGFTSNEFRTNAYDQRIELQYSGIEA